MSSLLRLPWHWLPAALTAALVLYWHIDVPYHDQWDLLPLLQEKIAGTLTWRAMLAPHNGHILLLPRAIMLALATLTHWNTLAEVLFSFCCMLACWRLLHYFTAGLLTRPPEKSEQFCLALLVFSWAQAQNWLWGWQLQVPLALLCSLCGFACILLLHHAVAAFFAAAIFGLAASASFAGSLPYWLAAMPLLWHRQKNLLLPWLIVCAGSAWLYLHGLGASAAVAQTLNLSNVPALLQNSLVLLGNLTGHYHAAAAFITAVSVLALVMASWHSTNTQQRPLILCLLLFSTGAALLVAATRGGMGSEQMLASRYGTLTLPLLIAAFAAVRRQAANDNTAMWSKIFGTLLLASCVASSLYSLKEFRQLHNRLHNGAVALTALAHNPADEDGLRKLAAINPRADQQQALAEVALLQQYRFSFFRNQPPKRHQ